MKKSEYRTNRKLGLKWPVIFMVLLIIAGVIWRVFFTNKSNELSKGEFPYASITTLVHAGTASIADVPVYLNALGTVVPNASVTVTSRVEGQLDAVYFTEGQKVEKGQMLAQIDPRPYQATLGQYQGELSKNSALLRSAELTLERYKKLFNKGLISRQDLDSQMASVGQYRGSVAADEAQIASAKLNIEYSQITAPISGRVGLRLVDPGNLVQGSNGSGLVTITQMQPAAVTFSVPQSNIPELIKTLYHGATLPATVFDQNGSQVLDEGAVQFISNQIDTNTGSVTLKALFPNNDETLYANQFVNLRLQTHLLPQATVVPAQAVQLSSEGNFVYVINQDNTVTRKAVTIGPLHQENQQVILSGVTPGERLVTDGIDRLNNGSKVSVVDDSQPQVGHAP